MTTDTTLAPKRKRREAPPGFVVTPLAVNYETAAAMIGISERAVERLVAADKLKAKRATDGRNVIAVAELERYLRDAPDVRPGVGDGG